MAYLRIFQESPRDMTMRVDVSSFGDLVKRKNLANDASQMREFAGTPPRLGAAKVLR